MRIVKPGDFTDERVKALLTRHLEGMHANSPPGDGLRLAARGKLHLQHAASSPPFVGDVDTREGDGLQHIASHRRTTRIVTVTLPRAA
jgi:hypothetical protein